MLTPETNMNIATELLTTVNALVKNERELAQNLLHLKTNLTNILQHHTEPRDRIKCHELINSIEAIILDQVEYIYEAIKNNDQDKISELPVIIKRLNKEILLSIQNFISNNENYFKTYHLNNIRDKLKTYFEYDKVPTIQEIATQSGKLIMIAIVILNNDFMNFLDSTDYKVAN